MVYDALDNHLAEASDIAAAAVPMGMLLAWCASVHLLSAEFQQEHERTVLRVRMQEVPGSELLIAGGGDLRQAMFNQTGQAFLARYYPRYLSDFENTFGKRYGVADNTGNYAKIAKVLTQAYMGKRSTGDGFAARIKRWFKA